MTRAPGELLRNVAKALACFASTKHAQAHVQRNPAIKAEMLLEVDRIEALEREVRDAAQAQADVTAERDSLLSGLREAVQVWTQKRDSNRRDGDRRGGIIYGAVVQRALDILNDQETDEPAQAQAGAGSEGGEAQ